MRRQPSDGANKIRIRIRIATLFGHPMFGYICHPFVPQKAESLSSSDLVECDTFEDPSVVFPTGSHQRPE
jgi:hypothetical protein